MRVGSGIPITPASCNLVELVQESVEELSNPQSESAVKITHRGDCSGRWDADRLAQVCSNLVANAMTHGPGTGPIEIDIERSNPQTVVLRIHNQGMIEPRLLSKLFEPLAGGDRRSESSRGLGLGLYITHQIVLAHAGDITVSSDERQGTTFVVSLPCVSKA